MTGKILKFSMGDDYTSFTFDTSITSDEEKKEEHRDDPMVTLELVYRVGWMLVSLLKFAEAKCLNFFSAACVLEDGWNAINYARLWSEKNHPRVDEYLVETLSAIMDAKAIVESSMAWEKYTDAVFLSLTLYVRSSIRTIGAAIMEIDSAITSINQGDESWREPQFSLLI